MKDGKLVGVLALIGIAWIWSKKATAAAIGAVPAPGVPTAPVSPVEVIEPEVSLPPEMAPPAEPIIPIEKVAIDIVPGAILEMEYIRVLAVNGIPFTKVATGPRCSLRIFAEHLEKVWAHSQATGYGPMVADSAGLANCVSSKINPCTATKEELADAIASCPEYLAYGGRWKPEAIGGTIASMWHPEEGTIPVAYLAEPIDGLKGITLTWANKKISRNADLVTFQWILGYEPQFSAPMPAPGFRTRESYTVQWPPKGIPMTMEIEGAYSGGYAYAGMYDGRVMVSYWTYNNPPYPIADFRIKNLALV